MKQNYTLSDAWACTLCIGSSMRGQEGISVNVPSCSLYNKEVTK